VDGQSSGTPTVFWDSPIDLAADGCTGGTATYTMKDAAGTTIASGSLTEGPSGHYTATVPPQTPNRGAMDVSIAFTCPNAADNSSAAFTLYIDPSGVVSDTHAAPVAGATVTLMRSDAATGPFTAVTNGDGSVMSPSNQANPSTTDGVGHYGWDVVAGYYKVTASKADCYAPGSYDPVAHTVQPVVASAVQTIPPAVTNLDLTLDCTNLAPVAAFTQSVTSGHPGVSVHLDAGSAVDPNGSVASYHWDFGDGTPPLTTASPTADHVYSAIGAYTPTLTVVDDQGASSVLKSGNPVTVADAPGQVTGLSAVSGLHSVALSWTAPAANGSPITGYTVDVTPGGQHLTPTGTGVTVTGLTGNTSYTFAVRAVNAFGTGLAGSTLGVAGATGTHPSVAITAAPPAYTDQTAGQVSFTAGVDPCRWPR
jgi:PKD repeat protein